MVTAWFAQREEAVNAVKWLNNATEKGFKSIRISANCCVSIKFSVLADLGNAIREDLEAFIAFIYLDHF